MKHRKCHEAGEVFNNWTVVGAASRKGGDGALWWECRCVCGKVKDVDGSNLRQGRTKSCGCVNRVVFEFSKICPDCKIEKPRDGFYMNKSRGLGPYCKQCANKRKVRHYPNSRAAQKRSRDKKRALILAGYGCRCACCGETKPEFLAIDHVHGGGRQERLKIGWNGMYNKIIKENFPDDYQVLCHNCNFAKHATGGNCPHSEPSWDSPTWGGGPI